MQPESAAAPARLSPLLRLDSWIGTLEEWLGIALVAAMMGVVNLQVVARYLFDKPFIWPEEVSRLILIWLAFLGAAALIRRGGDIAVDTFIDMLQPRHAG
jgi:TRAP-type C4-dicarboxylate transport system permease small subunit